jgi:hypothetical protein
MHKMALVLFWVYRFARNHIDIAGDKKLMTYVDNGRIPMEELINMQLYLKVRVTTKGHLIRKDYHNKSYNLHKDRNKQSNARQICHAAETFLRT